MRFGAVATMTVFVAAGFVTFVPGCQLIETRSDASSSGGSTSTTSSSGGDASGGTSASGGTVASGGTTAKGGSGGSAGGAGSGGAGGGAGGTVASGGTVAKGGAGGGAGSGGVIATGGVQPKGGNGGTGAGATGGGTTVKGGAGGATTSVSNCTDEPPPGQTPTCQQWAGYNVCTQSWMANYCNKSCGRCSGTSQGGASGSGGSGGTPGSGGIPGSGGTSVGGNGGVSGPGTTNPPITGTQGWASRYWDCCKPSCGWSGNSNPPVPSCGKDGKTRVGADQKNGCEGGGSAFECYDFHPWYDAATNMAYGFAAKNGVSCGACFMLQFTGDSHNGGANPGVAAIKGQQMVVQAINIGGIESNQFDLLIPGGGVGAMNGCSTQWGSSTDLGVQYGGLLSECKGDAACMKGKCQSVFGSMPDLKEGCDWFTGWFASADNPNLIYKQVSCPEQLKSKTGISR